MNIKKISLLVASGLMFVIVMTTVITTISKSVYQSNERELATLSNEMQITAMTTSFHYVEVKEEVKKEEQEIVKQTEEIKEEEKIKEEEEVSANPEEIYVGKLTGYGGDCANCSGTLACRTFNGSSFNLKNDGMYYQDYTYGNVRILSAATSAFPCGSIIKVNNGIMEEFTAIVLDTGGSMRKAWNNGKVWMDLAFQTQSDPSISNANSNNTTFTVLRKGW